MSELGESVSESALLAASSMCLRCVISAKPISSAIYTYNTVQSKIISIVHIRLSFHSLEPYKAVSQLPKHAVIVTSPLTAAVTPPDS